MIESKTCPHDSMDLQTLDVVDWVEPSILSGELGIVPAST